MRRLYKVQIRDASNTFKRLFAANSPAEAIEMAKAKHPGAMSIHVV